MGKIYIDIILMRIDAYNGTWNAENPNKEGVQNGRYKSFDIGIKYDLNKPEHKKLA